MNKQELIESLTDTFKVCLETAIKKNADYSSIEDPFKNFRMSTQVWVSPERAILVRLSDKLSRISNLLDKPNDVLDETITDSILDGINYLALLRAYRQQ